MKNKEYLAVKNLWHNEFKLSKEEIKRIIVECIKDEAKAQVKQYLQQDPNLDKTIKEQVFKQVSNAITGRTYDKTRDEFFKTIGIEIVKQLKIDLNK